MTKPHRRISIKGIAFSVIGLFMCALILAALFSQPFRLWTGLESQKGLTVRFMDVGQGDASLLLFEDGSAAMIDTGTVSRAERLVGNLRMQGVEKLRYLILSHPHDDHIGGAAEVLRSFEVETVVIPMVGGFEPWVDFCEACRENGCETVIAVPGMVFSLGNGEIEVLGPRERYDDENDNSLYLRVTYGETAFLFPGDAGYFPEHDLMFAGSELDCDVLKLGHHGSSSATSLMLIKQASPAYAVASCGRFNTYGHPAPEVLSDLKDAGVEVCRTDTMGDIVFFSDGKTVTLRRYPYG